MGTAERESYFKPDFLFGHAYLIQRGFLTRNPASFLPNPVTLSFSVKRRSWIWDFEKFVNSFLLQLHQSQNGMLCLSNTVGWTYSDLTRVRQVISVERCRFYVVKRCKMSFNVPGWRKCQSPPHHPFDSTASAQVFPGCPVYRVPPPVTHKNKNKHILVQPCSRKKKTANLKKY